MDKDPLWFKHLGTQWWTGRIRATFTDTKPANNSYTENFSSGKCSGSSSMRRFNIVRVGWSGQDSSRKSGHGCLPEEVTFGQRPKY
jgi:hypothetical protein